MEELLKESVAGKIFPGISFKYLPDEKQMQECFEFGRRFGLEIK